MHLLRVLRAAWFVTQPLVVVPWWAEAALRRRRRLLHAAAEALRRGRFSGISSQTRLHCTKDRCPFRNDYTFDWPATSHVTPSRAAAREVATGRPPPTRTASPPPCLILPLRLLTKSSAERFCSKSRFSYPLGAERCPGCFALGLLQTRLDCSRETRPVAPPTPTRNVLWISRGPAFGLWRPGGLSDARVIREGPTTADV